MSLRGCVLQSPGTPTDGSPSLWYMAMKCEKYPTAAYGYMQSAGWGSARGTRTEGGEGRRGQGGKGGGVRGCSVCTASVREVTRVASGTVCEFLDFEVSSTFAACHRCECGECAAPRQTEAEGLERSQDAARARVKNLREKKQEAGRQHIDS